MTDPVERVYAADILLGDWVVSPATTAQEVRESCGWRDTLEASDTSRGATPEPGTHEPAGKVYWDPWSHCLRLINDQGADTVPELAAALNRCDFCSKALWNWTVSKEDLALQLGTQFTLPKCTAGTEREATQEHIEQTVERVFEAAKDEYFEDGMESSFSRELVFLVETYSEVMKELLTYWLLREKASAYVGSEALRWLGRMEHAPTYQFRRWLLERCLVCSSPMVRDGAGLGLAAMDDPHAIGSLKEAIEREPCAELRLNLQLVLAQLEG